jgi:hypothetical protein
MLFERGFLRVSVVVTDPIPGTLSIFDESVCEKLIKGRKARRILMLSSKGNVQECDARDDRFCTGADFIKQKYVSIAFQFQLIKFYNFRPDSNRN